MDVCVCVLGELRGGKEGGGVGGRGKGVKGTTWVGSMSTILVR